MVLSTHAVVGAAVASLFPGNLPLAFGLAVVSHYAADAIPHRDYRLKSHVSDKNNKLNDSLVISKDSLGDILKISFDFTLGVALAVLIYFFIHPVGLPVIICGIVGGVLPDGLQFVYAINRSKFMSYVQRWHNFTHYNHGQEDLKVSPLVGFSLQALVATAVVYVTYLISALKF